MNSSAKAFLAAVTISSVVASGFAIGDVGPDGVGKDYRFLCDDAELLAERTQGDLGGILAVDEDSPAV